MTDRDDAAPFWKTVPLAEMTSEQWESLCDGCGKCCLVKLIDDVTDDLHYTDVACRLLDCQSCRCADYANRAKLVPDCVQLKPELLEELVWMPSTCAYRLVREGKDLHWWHPLVSGDPGTVHEAGISVRGRAISEVGLSDEELIERIVDWAE